MSVAYELFPAQYGDEWVEEWTVPAAAPARVGDLPARHRGLASVSVLHPPRAADSAPALRLTRRGQVVLALVVAALGAVFVWLAAGSAPAASAHAPVPATVTVQPGDTVWSIAARVAPESDPRAVVAALEQRNHLIDAELMPGQVLRTR